MLPETTEYLTAINTLRQKVLKTLSEAEPAAWNWTPLEGDTNSLYVLATHAVGSEHGWITEILGNGAKTRNRDAEFHAAGTALAALQAEYARVAHETETLLSGLTSEDLMTPHYRESHGQVTGRWIILHVIEHYSEHLGQMYLTKQLWEQNRARG